MLKHEVVWAGLNGKEGTEREEICGGQMVGISSYVVRIRLSLGVGLMTVIKKSGPAHSHGHKIWRGHWLNGLVGR